MEIAVCTGGACLESGAELLVEACSVLAAGDAKLEVKTVFCSGECPANFAMLCPSRGMVEAYEAACSTTEDAIASATEAIVAADSSVSAGLTEAFIASTEAKAAEKAGDMAAAMAKYSETLACAPADLLEPCQAPLEPEALIWAGSRWAEDVFKSDLSVSESAAATCGGGQALVDGKVVTSPSVTLLEESCAIDGLKYSGRWEDSTGRAGAFEVTMSDDGRTFDGSLSHDDGKAEVAWGGLRKSVPQGRGGRGGGGRGGGRGRGGRGGRGRGAARGEAPPSRAKWAHDAMLGKSKCALALGDAAAAVEDARAATVLCCRAPSGYVALEAALEASGDAAGAEAARREVAYLKSA